MLPFCIKALYHSPNFLFSATQQSRQIQEKRAKTMVANLGMKHKSETKLEAIGGLVLDFDLYFVTV